MNLEKILKNDKRIWDEDILDYPQLFELARTYDKDLLETLFNNKDSKEKFFIQVGDSHVFKYNEFRFYLEQNQVNNSFTQYANKIGLASQGEHLSDSTDYVLDWPYKDCVLEGGMSSEEDTDTFIEKKVETTPGKMDKKTGTMISPEKTEVTFSQAKRKREEIFYNNIIADKEIDRLLDKKALKNFTRYTAKGEEEVKEIKRDEDGTIKENLLIKGNNLLALHSLKEQFAGKVKLIYIDPPYNTGGSEEIFTYNNRFNHSTWLTFMKNRLEIAKEFLREDGFIAIAIDHAELFYLGALSDQVFDRENRIGLVTVVHKPEGRQHSKFFSPSNEYMLVYAKNKELAKFNKIVLLDEKKKEFNEVDDKGFYKWKEFVRKDTLRNQKKAGFYPIYVSKDLKKISTTKFNNSLTSYPIDSKGTERVWNVQEKGFNEKLQNGEVKAEIKDEKVKIFYKIREQQVFVTHWTDKRYNSTANGTFLVKKYLDGKSVSYPKSLYTVQDTIKIMTNDGDIIMDFFAGSSTTAHASLSLDIEDNQNRQFIMIEQVEEHYEVSTKRISQVLSENNQQQSNFIAFELAEYNEEAKNKIDACTSFKDLKKLFTELTECYFLNYNVSVKQFNDQILDDKDFQELPLEEQKTLFKALLDNNQLYIPYKEQEDGKHNLSKEDQELTNEFYG
jgi:adenine-specific DNA-methyltransferase